MKKIVINSCYGGFGVSHEGIIRYFEIKGLTVYPEKDMWGYTYWIVAPEDRMDVRSGDAFYELSIDERQAHNKKYSEQTFYTRGIERDDPVLIQVVEELGKKADSECAKLIIVEIPDDVEWQIEEYDGVEWVAEKHRTWR